jgi:Zn-dependent metalloprotease
MSLEPRRRRQEPVLVAGAVLVPRRVKRRTIYDAKETRDLPGRTIRIEGGRRTGDPAANEAYDFTGETYDYFRRAHGRRSLDDRGMRLESSVHFAERFNNAHWDGRQMIFGDGDGKYFNRFTGCIDVVAHELTHGVIQYAAGIGASGECGALAEHFADVFGILVRQHRLRQTASRADWTIGRELLTSRVRGEGIRSMRSPGSAYDDPILGRDPQPSHMRDFVRTNEDDRGVHINSGIPNHAFWCVATLLGGRAWEVAGAIWYRALTRAMGPRSRFQHCADETWLAAVALHGRSSEPEEAVLAGWRAVGIAVSPSAIENAPKVRRRRRRAVREATEPPTGGAPAFHVG